MTEPFSFPEKQAVNVHTYRLIVGQLSNTLLCKIFPYIALPLKKHSHNGVQIASATLKFSDVTLNLPLTICNFNVQNNVSYKTVFLCKINIKF
jgi:hypothetical protein